MILSLAGDLKSQGTDTAWPKAQFDGDWINDSPVHWSKLWNQTMHHATIERSCSIHKWIFVCLVASLLAGWKSWQSCQRYEYICDRYR